MSSGIYGTDIKKKFSEMKRPLVLDGAMGTLLIERGVKPHGALWTTLANYENPELVKQIHKEYIRAGAEIITTNTFNSNPASLKLAGKDENETEKLTELALSIAKKAREEMQSEVIIAGCNAPAEDCYQRERTLSRNELLENHERHIDALWKNGADIIWNETHGHFDEIKIVCEICERENLPYVINFYFEEDLRLLSGEKLSDAVDFVLSEYPNAIIGFNCIAPKELRNFTSGKFVNKLWGFYLNCGSEDRTNGEMFCAISPEAYIGYIKEIIDENTVYVGSCCGSNPEHTEKIKEYLIERYKSKVDSEN